jgi:dienelactone hydrolase
MKTFNKILVLALSVMLGGCASSSDRAKINSINYYDKKEVGLDVEVVRVNSSTMNAPTMIWMHGCGGLVGNHKVDWARDLNSWGYNVVVVDAFSPRGIRSVCNNTFSFPRLQFGYDAYYVAKWIKQQSWGAGKVGVIGYSFGAGAILEMVKANTLKQEFDDIVISAGVAYYPFCLVMSSQPGVFPVQLHLAGRDEITPPQGCIDTAKGWQDGAIIEYYKEASHGFDITGANFMLGTAMGPRLVKWSPSDDKLSRNKTKEFLDSRLKPSR